MSAEQTIPQVYIGWDPREIEAYNVAVASLLDRATVPVAIHPLVLTVLRRAGLMRRPTRLLKKGRHMLIQGGQINRPMVVTSKAGVLWDDISGAPMATEFAISRFLPPILQQQGWVAFTDCDVAWLADIAELWALRDPRYAVMCVQHGRLEDGPATKMDGQPQLPYQRKNWSSVMLFNCDHVANRRLTLDMVNTLPGRDLHRFCWLKDHEIGSLPPAWNWLVGVQPCPAEPKLAHFTLGGPWLKGWSPREHDDIWLSVAKAKRPRNRAGDPGTGQAAVQG